MYRSRWSSFHAFGKAELSPKPEILVLEVVSASLTEVKEVGKQTKCASWRQVFSEILASGKLTVRTWKSPMFSGKSNIDPEHKEEMFSGN
jgi:hypothetical protein